MQAVFMVVKDYRVQLGSQAGKGAIASGFQKEQLRQQAAMLSYWRNVYDQKMDALVEGNKTGKGKRSAMACKDVLKI